MPSGEIMKKSYSMQSLARSARLPVARKSLLSIPEKTQSYISLVL